MKWFYDMKISAKLLTGFIVVAMIAGAIGYIGIINVHKLAAESQNMHDDMLMSVVSMAQISHDIEQVRITIGDIVQSEKADDKQKFVEKIKEYRQDMDKASKEYESSYIDETDKANFKEFTDARIAYRSLLDKVIELALAGKNAEAINFNKTEAAKAGNAADLAAEKVIEYNVKSAKAVSDKNNGDAKTITGTIIALTTAGVIFAIFLGIFIARIISRPIKNMADAADTLARGDVEIDISSDTKDEVGLLAASFRNVIENIKTSAQAAQQIAAGDLAVEIKAKSDKDVLSGSMMSVVETLRGLVSEAAVLTKAAVEGKLATRGNADKFKGGYKDIVSGVNATLDAVIGPLNMAANYVDRISRGDIPPKITDTYNGDFNTIKNNLNTCIGNINTLTTDANMLVTAAVEGKLATRADSAKHGGDYRKIVEGVNKTLDAVIGPLNVAANYVDRISKGDIPNHITDNYNGDFNTIKNNINVLIGAMNLITDLAKEIAQGNMVVEVRERSAEDELMRALGLMVYKLSDVVSEVKLAADDVAAGSIQLSSGAQEMSQGATEQAAAAEEASSSMEQMTSSIRQNSDNSQQTRKIADKSAVNARDGGKAVAETVSAMKEIAGKISII
ncbi:MAG: MCP four helix bundle domain-containing protein, partial [Nitrospirae bacterium]|nr:MCP four helix bundle domain-containing protein [Nitrospirota bacterium]